MRTYKAFVTIEVVGGVNHFSEFENKIHETLDLLGEIETPLSWDVTEWSYLDVV